MADFNWYLNRQGVKGKKGDKGDQGFSPSITIKTDTPTEFVMTIHNEFDSFDTPNIIPTAMGDKLSEIEVTLTTQGQSITTLTNELDAANSRLDAHTMDISNLHYSQTRIMNAISETVNEVLNLKTSKQNKLVEGDNITLSNNEDGTVTISSTGGEGDVTADGDNTFTGTNMFVLSGTGSSVGGIKLKNEKFPNTSSIDVSSVNAYLNIKSDSGMEVRATENMYIQGRGVDITASGNKDITLSSTKPIRTYNTSTYESDVIPQLHNFKEGDNISITKDSTTGDITISSTASGGGVEIDDTTPATDKTYSSEKIESELDVVKTDISTVETSVTSLEESVSTLETTVTTTQENLETLESEVTSLKETVDAIEIPDTSNFVTLDTDQNITGIKRFDSTLKVSESGGLIAQVGSSAIGNNTGVKYDHKGITLDGKGFLGAFTIQGGTSETNATALRITNLWKTQIWTPLEISKDMSVTGTATFSGMIKDKNGKEVLATTTATTDSLGIVKPDGTTITIDEDGTISAVGGGGSGEAPANMVTTDTTQTITGYKLFNNPIRLAQWRTDIAGQPNNIDFTNGNGNQIISADSSAARPFGLYSNSSNGIRLNASYTSSNVNSYDGGLLITGSAVTFKNSSGVVTNLLAGPNNMVTTDTIQTISRDKTFNADINLGYTSVSGHNSRIKTASSSYLSGNSTADGGIYLRSDSTESGIQFIVDNSSTSTINSRLKVAKDSLTYTKTDGTVIDLLNNSGGGSSDPVDEKYGIQGDYATHYGIIDCPNGLIDFNATNKDIVVNQGIVLKCAGNGNSKTTISGPISHTVESTGSFTLFYAQGNLLECGKVDYSVEEPTDNGVDNYQAWFNPDKEANPDQQWKFKSNDSGNVWRYVTSATPIADFVAGSTGITSVSYIGYRVIDDDVFAQQSDIESIQNDVETLTNTVNSINLDGYAVLDKTASQTFTGPIRFGTGKLFLDQYGEAFIQETAGSSGGVTIASNGDKLMFRGAGLNDNNGFILDKSAGTIKYVGVNSSSQLINNFFLTSSMLSGGSGISLTKNSTTGNVTIAASAPNNMVTTNTTQNISGAKYFNGSVSFFDTPMFDRGAEFTNWLDDNTLNFNHFNESKNTYIRSADYTANLGIEATDHLQPGDIDWMRTVDPEDPVYLFPKSGKYSSEYRLQKGFIVTANLLDENKFNVDNYKNIVSVQDSYVTSCASPTDGLVNLTIGATGSTYTAPFDGWFMFAAKATATGQFIRAVSTKGLGVTSYITVANETGRIILPVQKGDVVTIGYTATKNGGTMRWIPIGPDKNKFPSIDYLDLNYSL